MFGRKLNRTYGRDFANSAATFIGTCVILAVAAIDLPPVHATDRVASGTNDAIGLFGTFGSGQKSSGPKVIAGPRLVSILENTEDGETVTWTNDQTGAAYRVKPVATYTARGRLCRTFSIRRTADVSVRESHRTACREADGRWNVAAAPGSESTQ